MIHHFAYSYASLIDLLANFLRFKETVIHPYWYIIHGPPASLHCRSYTGNQIDLDKLVQLYRRMCLKCNSRVRVSRRVRPTPNMCSAPDAQSGEDDERR